nr:MAG: replication initiator protein [Microviridae sp.]
MPCYHPLTAWRSASGRLPNGKWPLVFKLRDGIKSTEIQTPCGQCIGCRLERSRQWAIRAVHEAQMHNVNCFITLTYDNCNINNQKSLNPRDLELFWKRLRKENHEKIRYLACGEYGEAFSRPHYHACVFNYDVNDCDYFTDSSGNEQRTSDTLAKCWGHGFVQIGELTFESAAYVARYCTKLVTGEQSKYYYAGRKPEFIRMSRRPGIGRSWYDKYKNDLYPNDQCVIRDHQICRPAKYYDKLYDVDNNTNLNKIKLNRIKNINKSEQTKKRLKCRELSTKLILNNKRRAYEK